MSLVQSTQPQLFSYRRIVPSKWLDYKEGEIAMMAAPSGEGAEAYSQNQLLRIKHIHIHIHIFYPSSLLKAIVPVLMSFSYFPDGVLKTGVWHASPHCHRDYRGFILITCSVLFFIHYSLLYFSSNLFYFIFSIPA